ncbi:SulP family inorganic anion transporter [candidate division KSB1 bacterium]|nr:SulP family inorganic anion transporter [candidate division KSB1 bacterium]
MEISKITDHIRTYNKTLFRRDIIAGLTVTFVAIPQSMVYALIAGVEPQYGLYAFMVGSIVGSIFGSSRHLNTGPTNATSIVIASTLALYSVDDQFLKMVFLLGFLSGCLQLGAGLLKLSNLTHFLSRSVLAGFIGGAGLFIIVNQMPNLMGFSKNTNSSVFEGVKHIFNSLDQIQPTVLLVGIGSILLTLLINRLSPKTTSGIPILPSYLISILLSAAIVVIFDLGDTVKVVGDIPRSLPPLSMPLFELESIQTLMQGAIAIAFIGLAEATSAAKIVADFAGDKLQVDKEFRGQGLAKIATSFFSGIPVSGSFTRSLLCYRAGAETKMANIMAGIFVAIAVLFFGPVIKHIPLAALAGIVMLIASNMVDWKYVKMALRSSNVDSLAILATFFAALFFSLVTAIYIGVGFSLVLFLRRVKKPNLVELIYDDKFGFKEKTESNQSSIPELTIIHVEGDVFFASVDSVDDDIQKIAQRNAVKVIILRLKRAFSLDATSMMVFMKIYKDLEKQGKLLLISGAGGQVKKIIHESGLDKVIGEDHIFYSDENLFKSTRAAISYALQFINANYGTNYTMSNL